MFYNIFLYNTITNLVTITKHSMNTLMKRKLLFLFGCILSRLYLTYFVKHLGADKVKKYITSFSLMCIGIGFWYVYLSKSRKTGPEVFGDKIWWNSLRPLHGTLYLLSALYLFIEPSDAWKILFIDTLVGLSSFISFHSK